MPYIKNLSIFVNKFNGYTNLMEKYKKCPQCGSNIHIVARKCKYCGAHLDEKTTSQQTTEG